MQNFKVRKVFKFLNPRELNFLRVLDFSFGNEDLKDESIFAKSQLKSGNFKKTYEKLKPLHTGKSGLNYQTAVMA